MFNHWYVFSRNISMWRWLKVKYHTLNTSVFQACKINTSLFYLTIWVFFPSDETTKQLAAHQMVMLCNPVRQDDNKAAALMRQKPGCKYFIGLL